MCLLILQFILSFDSVARESMVVLSEYLFELLSVLVDSILLQDVVGDQEDQDFRVKVASQLVR